MIIPVLIFGFVVFVLAVSAIANASGGTVKRRNLIEYQSPSITDSGNVCNGCSTAGINSGQRGGEPETTEWSYTDRTDATHHAEHDRPIVEIAWGGYHETETEREAVR